MGQALPRSGNRKCTRNALTSFVSNALTRFVTVQGAYETDGEH
jgi:hypothetical protein